MIDEIDIIVPVYNEGSNIAAALAEVYSMVARPKRVLIVYDFDEDDTVPVVRELMPQYPGLELVRNNIGRGIINAIRAGVEAARSDVVIVSMADLSDDLRVVDDMVQLIRDGGYDIVCASRYMRGGRHIGGPLLKRTISRFAGLSLYWLGGLPTHDATNAFRAYRLSVLRDIPIESSGGFEYSLEITAKAHVAGRRVTEVPSTWRDRTAGESRFQLMEWLPHYFKWYVYAVSRGRVVRTPDRSTVGPSSVGELDAD
ncbi:glycosyltransferase [Mycobacterium sp. CVI_P3]|uniref:Glycosyltransferase n=1 Tax=Mycobacterium pinniadriaticum TaxID=2994102 RepID=A0ABT3SLW0_9MYCO|nr:glycosyltransferase [Mycobacterium pinniadriaticum]MCX2933910.1 glycosyltransferase [Mycobacterium pinniadriaticum]MCX2940332.1 glycosyltransferase [Mycobacterium pinniadriaticum]